MDRKYLKHGRFSVLSWPRLLSPWSRVFLGRVCGAPEMCESASPESSSPHPDHPCAASPETRPSVHQGCPRFLRTSASGRAGPGTAGALEVEEGLTHTQHSNSRTLAESRLLTKLEQKQPKRFELAWADILSLSGKWTYFAITSASSQLSKHGAISTATHSRDNGCDHI